MRYFTVLIVSLTLGIATSYADIAPRPSRGVPFSPCSLTSIFLALGLTLSGIYVGRRIFREPAAS